MRGSPHRWAVLAVLTGAVAVISLDNTIVNVALPSIQEDLGASAGELQWVVDSYSVVFAGLLLIAGSLGDRFGRRRILLSGLIVFGAGSVGAGLAADASSLIAMRALMGVGGALMMPSTLSILAQVFQNPGERARAIGVWAAVAGAAVALGPIVGGLLLESLPWQAIFWVNPPLVVAVLVGTLVLVPESRDASRPRLDPLGAILSTIGLVSLTVTVISLPDRGIDPLTMTTAATAIAALVGFIAWEHRAPRPLLPLALFRSRLFTVSVVCVGLVYFALMGAMFFLPQFLQLVQGFTPLESGLAVVPGAGGMLVASLVSPIAAERFGTRRIVVLGLAAVATGLLVMSSLAVDSGYGHVAVGLGLMGLGLGMVLPQATNGILATVPRERSGVGAAVNDAIGELGGSLGVAVLGALLSLGYRSRIEEAITSAGSAAADIPERILEAVRESLAATVLAVQNAPPESAAAIRAVAGTAFDEGMTTALVVAAVVAGVGLALAWWLFPARVDRVEE